MTFKMKMAFIFQPYLLLVLLGIFATFGYYHYAENKYMAFIGVAITIGNLYAYIKVLLSKAIIIRGVENKLILIVLCICAGFGQAKYDMGTTSSIIMATALTMLFAMDAKFLHELLTDTKFIKDFNYRPDLTIFIQDLKPFNIFKSAKDRKIKFRSELYTYINNGIIFDHKGIKDSKISFDEIEKYTQDSMSSIKDFNKDDLKTIEMLRY